MMMSMKTIVLMCVILLAGCRTRGGGGGLWAEHGLPHPERIAMAVASGFEAEGFTVTVVTNAGYHISFHGSTVAGSVDAATSGVDWTIRQDRWRPWGAAEYDRARRVIDQNVKE